MEPDNIEKLIQDNFKDRSIEPSSQARERFIVALNNEPKKKKKLWINYAVAASLVLGLLLFVGGKLLFKDGVVEQPIEISFEKELPKDTQNEITPNPIKQNNALVLEDQQDSNHKTEIKQRSKMVSNSKELKSKNKVAEQNLQTNKEDELQIENPTTIIEKELVKSKETEDIAVIKLPKQFEYITAEQLLESAGKDSSLILIQNKKQLSDSYLDSDQLLLEMEKELFDEKNKSIFKKAGKQLKQLNEAVANRNYEHNN